MFIKEYRVAMPLSLEEYRRGELYTTAEFSKAQTGGGEGVEWLGDVGYDPSVFQDDKEPLGVEPQCTLRLYHLGMKMPDTITKLASKGSLEFEEYSCDAFPYVRTAFTNTYLKKEFYLTIQTINLPDRCTTSNALNLNSTTLAKRTVQTIDIANDQIDPRDIDPSIDPKTFVSKKTGRGPLGADWINKSSPVMCSYKLVTFNVNWFGLSGTIESLFERFERRLFLNFNRQMFCHMDQWYDLKMEDIRRIEEETKNELDVLRATGSVRGMFP